MSKLNAAVYIEIATNCISKHNFCTISPFMTLLCKVSAKTATM